MEFKALDDIKVHVRFKLSALWAAIMFCYIYGDFWNLWRPGNLQEILEGQGPIGPVSQGTLVAVTILVAIPAVMIFLSLVLQPKVVRWLSIAVGTILTVLVVITIPGAWAFYVLMSAIEVVLQVLVVWYAWSWPGGAAE